jgi:signal transduction histidine kinase/ActR/RegA family two-component response regulator
MEVSARYMRDFLHVASAFGISRDELLADLPIATADLESARGRVPWSECVTIFERACARMGSEERIEELGRRSVQLTSSWALVRIVPHFISPRGLLRIAFGFAGPSIFPHMHHTVEERPGGVMRLTLSLPPPYQGCQPYFRMCVGGVSSIPTLLGYSPAVVGVKALGPGGVTLDVTLPPSRTIAGRLRHAFSALGGETALFEEVARQHESLHEVFGELLRTQSELRELMESIPDTIVVHRDGVIVWGNRALLAALKCKSLEQLRGKHIVDFLNPVEEEAAARRTPLGDALTGTHRMRAMDGSFRRFEVSKPQGVTFEGAPARMSVARDVTERDALRQQLVLADRMTQLGFLAAGVAHEINNPLAYALTALDVAGRELTRGRSDAVARELATAREGAERVRAITRDLRMFSRGGEECIEAVDVSEVLRATVDLAAANVRTDGRLVTELGPLPTVLGDAARIGQVFMNLLVNALDAIRDRDPSTSRIRVRAFTDAAGHAVIEVEDNGRGIPPDVLPRIFEPFFTTKAPRSGTGLGLAICERIVGDLGGRIEALSPPEHAQEAGGASGALFRVTLPACTAPVVRPPSPPVTREAKGTRRLRVLVVDDEPPLARALGQMLQDEHDVEVVTSGEDAMRRLDAGAEYDVILCDLMRAGVGGVDVHDRLRAERPEMARRIVFMTGGVFSTRTERFLAEVKNTCLDKPFTQEGVRAALEAAASGAASDR